MLVTTRWSHHTGKRQLMTFGSVALGTAEPSSDVDIPYELRPGRRLGW